MSPPQHLFVLRIYLWQKSFKLSWTTSKRRLMPPLSKLTLRDWLKWIRDTAETEKYLYLDPKGILLSLWCIIWTEGWDVVVVVKSRVGEGKARSVTPFRESIVFVLGGGNYAEYQNLQDHAKKTSTPTARKSISTRSIVSAEVCASINVLFLIL